MVPTAVAKLVTEKLTIPSIGIGAGNVCDGQILVTDDMLGKFTDFVPRFVRRYADLSQVCEEAIAGYARDVKSGNFPNASESFLLPKDEEQSLSKQVGQEKSQAGEVC